MPDRCSLCSVEWLRDIVVTVTWLLIVITVLGIALVTGSLAWVVQRQRRRHCLGGSERMKPPAAWLYSPGEAPRMHRRLVASVDCARGAAKVIETRRSVSSGVGDLVAELEERAGMLADGLVLAGRLRQSSRQRVLARLSPGVEEVERVAERLAEVAALWDHGSARDSTAELERLHRRLDALEAAHQEIAELERSSRG